MTLGHELANAAPENARLTATAVTTISFFM
jgi:hypothetical protein